MNKPALALHLVVLAKIAHDNGEYELSVCLSILSKICHEDPKLDFLSKLCMELDRDQVKEVIDWINSDENNGFKIICDKKLN